MVTIRFPYPFRKYTAGHDRADVQAETVAEAFQRVFELYPRLRAALLDEVGQFHRFVNVYLDGDDIRGMAGADTLIAGAHEMLILPAMAGGEDAPLTPADLERYSRNIPLGEVGI